MGIFRITAFTLALLFSGTAWGQDLAAAIDECEACHGKGGVSAQEDIPSLAGRPADELFEALEAFYYYERHCTTTTYREGDRPKTPMNMCNVANTLSVEEKKAIAAHFAGAD
jgi:cytochrome c553